MLPDQFEIDSFPSQFSFIFEFINILFYIFATKKKRRKKNKIKMLIQRRGENFEMRIRMKELE